MDRYGGTLSQSLEAPLNVFKLAKLCRHPVRSVFLRRIPDDFLAITVTGNIRRANDSVKGV
jgi:hypothetical protein